MLKYFYLFLLIVGLAQCRPVDPLPQKEDRLMAQVYNRQLHLSELEAMLPSGGTKEDSLLVANAYIERWVRENLLMHEAEKNVSKDLNIDQLVRNYRASLVKHNYEKLLVELQLDSIVGQAELTEYYEANKNQYKLESSIARCYFIKAPLAAEGIADLKQMWKNRDDESTLIKLLEYTSTHATIYMLEESGWYKIDDLLKLFPDGKVKFGEISRKEKVNFEDEEFLYLMDVFETVSVDNTAPIAYVKDQISKLILHKREIDLIEDKKEELYERETRLNNVKIYK